jgi:hypothetical protein
MHAAHCGVSIQFSLVSLLQIAWSALQIAERVLQKLPRNVAICKKGITAITRNFANCKKDYGITRFFRNCNLEIARNLRELQGTLQLHGTLQIARRESRKFSKITRNFAITWYLQKLGRKLQGTLEELQEGNYRNYKELCHLQEGNHRNYKNFANARRELQKLQGTLPFARREPQKLQGTLQIARRITELQGTLQIARREQQKFQGTLQIARCFANCKVHNNFFYKCISRNIVEITERMAEITNATKQAARPGASCRVMLWQQ